ncbi:MAG: hypothetical protein ACO21B_13940 [Gemmobacter sp.]
MGLHRAVARVAAAITVTLGAAAAVLVARNAGAPAAGGGGPRGAWATAPRAP